MTDAVHPEPVLRVRGVTRRFGGVVAVRDVDLDIAPGERRAVLGPNGAGKSTLFNLIAGADTPTSGSIELFGAEATRLGARQRTRAGLSRTFQTSRLLTGLTVEDNLYLAAVGVDGGRFRLLRSARDRTARERARATAASVGMTDRLDTLAGDLSHGEQRQLEIGLALVAEPRMLLLDEPAAGLSRSERQLLTALLLSLDRDVTLLLIEHDMDVALTVAERVTMMHDGVVIVEGTPAEIRADQRVHDLYLGKAHV
ncbi:ABC transporter, ATP-binding protein [Modestobacter italicus]|uniref:ABC transporter, ATP-binding protein n=1 Tax=Modestobacter italicus (strain DSM 44449 / CECT 9708 / BC 501) TaxID=2732864 RepID=I4EWM3_MODI5|nr:ABC transporter ATP-binding protein [Modestobacter marinus]CCH87786.1 ABC transporter, ATP-binding protein [Modestobacter marinus]